MKKLLVIGLLLSCTAFASDDGRYNHFPAKKSPTVEKALCNLTNYNLKLAEITQKQDMSAEDMVKIHELTYTLEGALNKLSEALAEAAFNLEEVHLASEKLEQATIKKHAAIYTEITKALSKTSACISN